VGPLAMVKSIVGVINDNWDVSQAIKNYEYSKKCFRSI
jgi:hypothetical protein